jgi:endothelin-converting enzyme/putative endopeptidase
MHLRSSALIGILIFSFSAIAAKSKTSTPLNPDPTLIDKKTDPCENFFQHACGEWIRKTKIPSDKPGWSRSFSVINEQNEKLLKTSLEKYSKTSEKDPQNPYSQQLGDFFGSCMNEKLLEKESVPYLKKELKKIDELKPEDLPEWVANAHLRGVGSLFSFGASQDMKHPEQMIAEFSQGGLSLPTRDYYFDQSERGKEILTKFRAFVSKAFQKLGDTKAKADQMADAVVKTETALAKFALPPQEMRDPQKLYHMMSVDSLQKLTPSFQWNEYFKTMAVEKSGQVNVAVPDYFKGLGGVLKELSLDELKSYFKLQLIRSASRGMPEAYYLIVFDFFGKTLSGIEKPSPRWKRCVQETDGELGFALGRTFVNLTFAGSSKSKAVEMIEQVEKAVGGMIDGLTWMDDKTKRGAKEKLATLVNQVGYPDKWRSYDDVKINKRTFLANRMNMKAFNSRYELAKIGKPVDRTEWYMTPSDVNAYYDPQQNKMVFPAGILQPIFFHADYPTASNYAAMGMVMGHEISHGYDDSGRQFDKTGAMADWWTKKSAERFQAQAQCLSDQYDTFPVAGGGHVIGKLTLGEDIGDQAGLKASFLAWKSTLPKEVLENAKVLEREERQFFLAFAQAWCDKDNDAFEQMMAKTDPHPPSRYRVNAPLMNFPEFASAYQCKAGTKMVPAKRCVVW